MDTLQLEPVLGFEGSLIIVRAPQVTRGLRFFPAALRRRFEARWLQTLEAKAERVIDIVWLFENSRFFDMSFAGDRVKIYHQVDLDQNYHVKLALRSADLRLAHSEVVLKSFAKYGYSGNRIDHGVNLSCEPDSEVVGPKRSMRPQSAVIGNFNSHYLDAALLRDLVAANPGVDFNFVGAADSSCLVRQGCAEFKWVKWWGQVSSANVISIARSMDVLLVVYDMDRFAELRTNPHKLMEYMASGVVTVATWTEDYADKRNLLAMVERSEDFLPTFSEVIGNLSEWNSPSRRVERIEFAADNTYERQIDRISDFLNATSTSLAQVRNIHL